MADTPTIDQEDFGWFNDDGTDESDSTTAASTNVALTNIDLDGGDVDYQLRFVCRETAGNAKSNHTDQYQSDLNSSASWEDVLTTENNDGVAVISNTLTNNGDTTQRIGGGSFITTNFGQTTDGSPGGEGGSRLDFAGSDEAEFVVAIRFTAANINDGDSIAFRLSLVDTRSGTNPTISFTKSAPSGRVMSSLAGAGGLVGAGGIVGPGGGLAG